MLFALAHDPLDAEREDILDELAQELDHDLWCEAWAATAEAEQAGEAPTEDLWDLAA